MASKLNYFRQPLILPELKILRKWNGADHQFVKPVHLLFIFKIINQPFFQLYLFSLKKNRLDFETVSFQYAIVLIFIYYTKAAMGL